MSGTTYTGDAIYESFRNTEDILERIASALEVIAGDITERKRAEQASLRSQLEHLEREAGRAGEQFGSADRAAMRNPGVPLDEGTRDWIRHTEQAMNDAYAELEAFKAAHPELLETAVA